MRENIQVEPDKVDPDYYLFSFDDFELIEIFKQPDEWGRFDYALARKILESRGIVYTNDELDAFWKSRIETLAKPEKEGKSWVYAGRAFALTGGFFGIIIGLVLMHSTKALPDGRKVYTYDEETRKQGRIILVISAIVFAIFVVFVFAGGQFPLL